MRLLVILFASFLAAAVSAAGDRPNVLFIAVDDLRPELASYGVDIHTPNFDRLAETGVQFQRAYCQQAVCGASRLSIMGGLYPTLTGEQTYHIEGWRERHPDLITMNQHFGAQGYQTIGLGKIYHGTNGVAVDKSNWQQWLYQGAPTYKDPENIAAAKEAKEKAKSDPKMEKLNGPTTESADVADTAYSDGLRAQRAAQVLGELAGQEGGKPFFFGVGFTKPHLPFVAPQKYWDLYQRDDFAMPANKGIPPGYPVYAANQNPGEIAKYSDIFPKKPLEYSDELNKRLLHGYAACCSYTDANLGKLLDALDKHGLADNTIVVLWGDHGWKLGDHSSWCKHTNLEVDTRVPLLMRVPGGVSGAKTQRLVELIDLYPTLCDLTGIATPEHCQGRSFKKLFSDPEAGHRNYAYSSYPARKEMGHSVRFGNFRYTEWHREDGSQSAGVLTNLKVDPGEQTNSIDDPKYSEVLEKGKTYIKSAIDHAMKPKQQKQQQEAAVKKPTPEETPALKAAVGDRFHIGVGTSLKTLESTEDLALLKKHFTIVTPENCMKSTKVQKVEGEFTFEKADRFVEICEREGLDVVGHCLIWARPGTTPAWFFKDGEETVSKEKLLERLRTHIHTVAGRYKGRVKMWDVVNEALADSDKEYLRDIEWNNILGEEFLVKAFQYAKEADPDALLVYNDYRCDHPGKLEKLVRLIKSVREQGGPIEALGLQAHYEYGMIPYEGIERALKAMDELGVKVVFSELDMDVVTRARWYYDGGKHREEMKSWNPYPTVPANVLDQQAAEYAKLFQIMDTHSDTIARVSFWNLHDGHSWLNYWPWQRTNHPLFFDRQGLAKPALFSVVETLSKG